MNKLGVMLGDLGASQLAYNVVKSLNDECKKNEGDFVAFVENISNFVVQPAFAVMGVNEIWSFDGVLIATSVSTSAQMINSVNASQKYFYVWDLEWMRPHGHDFQYNVKAFNDPSIQLIARSVDHALAIKNYCNRDVAGIVTDFNINELYEVIGHVAR